MSNKRIDLGFADTLSTFDPAEWSPTVPPVRERFAPLHEETQAIEAIGFRSREPKSVGIDHVRETSAPVRRRRTGRNAQINLKARPDTIEAYCAIADRMGWGLGETLEQAVALLEAHIAALLDPPSE